MINVIAVLKQMSVPPLDGVSFQSWLDQDDAVAFLQRNTVDDEFVLYANMPSIYMHAVLVPSISVERPNVEDLMSWHFDAYSSWGVMSSASSSREIEITPPLDHTGSVTFDRGEQLIFARNFEGRVGEKHYIEILQKFTHLSGLHYLHEKGSYCCLDRHGDVEEVIRMIEIDAKGQMFGGTIVTVKREVLDRYATLTDSAIVRTFDFTRFCLSKFGGWRDNHDGGITNVDDLFYRKHVEPGHASYMRGCQIVRSQVSKDAVIDEFHPCSEKNEEYASFIAHDLRHDEVREISCAPRATANYFVDSDLPFEHSPAFFRPEVLSKYKADSEKYRMDSRTISCRGTWSLQSYDINDVGQVHTYLVYLRHLPYEEQLHWKAHNEAPKSTISLRAYLQDFEGSWQEIYDPLESIHDHVRKLRDAREPWWTLRTEDTIIRSHYPITASFDEWADEILHLDQLIIEPFEKSWFKRELERLGKEPNPRFGSLVLTEETLSAWGLDADEAKRVVAPLRILHDLRSKLKGHGIGRDSLTQIKQQALTEYGSYKEHFRALCASCDQSLRKIASLIKAHQTDRNP
jgi:hypothetical protein